MKFNEELEAKVKEHFDCEITEVDYQILKILNNAVHNSGVLREGWLSDEEEERLKEWQDRGWITIEPNGFVISKRLKDILDEMFSGKED